MSESPVLNEFIVPEKGTSYWRDSNSQKGIYTKEIWDCNEINIENLFSFTIAIDITNDFEPQNIGESIQRHDWPTKAWLASRDRSNLSIIDFAR